MAEMNTLPANLVEIEKYPIDQIVDLKVTNLPLTDPLETKLRSILFCMNNDVIFCATEADSNTERKLLINETGKYITDSIDFLKNSFLTIDVIQFIVFDQTPVEGSFSESLANAIIDYKSSDHIKIFQEGIEKIVRANKGNYYLTEDLKRNIQSKLVTNQSKILDLLNFNEITTFDLKSLVSDGLSTIGGLLTPFLPLSTIQEIYTYLKKKKSISSDSDILFKLSVMYLQKVMAQNSSYTMKKQCDICKLTSIEIDNIDNDEVHNIIFKSTEHLCSMHLRKYLELRNFHGLMGKPLLRHMIEPE